MSIACSAVAVIPACLASLVRRSLTLSCLRVCRPFVQQAACLPSGSRMCWHLFPPGGVRPHCCPVPGAGNPSLWFIPRRNNGSRRVVSKLAGQAVQPFPMTMVALRPGRGIAWKIAKPLVPQGGIQVHSSSPLVANCS